MRFTRRLLDRRSSAALLILSCAAAASVSASCSSSGDDDGRPLDSADAATEAASSLGDAGAADALPLRDAASRDAAPFDGGPLPIVCSEPPCAKSLVTTLRASNSDRGEGYCALLDDGTVACWGANLGGQLGRGEDAGADDSSIPARVAGLSDVIRLDHTCAVNESGETWCWGTGPFLRGPEAWRVVTLERTPVKLAIPPATHVAMGDWAACAVVSDGVICWGDNSSGQVGSLADALRGRSNPPRAIGLPPGAPIRDLVVGSASFVLREDGTAVSWGSNTSIARESSIAPDPHPALVELAGIASIDIVGEDACAAAGGTGYCWGSPVLSPDGLPAKGGGRPFPEPVVVPEPVVQMAVTRSSRIYSAGVWTTDPYRWCAVGAEGHVYCWGSNANGQTGDGTKEHAYEAVMTQGLPAPAVQVKTMPSSTCALLTTGKVYCWGSNAYGQLGNGRPKGVSLVPQEVVLP